MRCYLSLVLHAHLPFVRHPEHERFLEESWLFEALIESYLPLLELLESWEREGLDAPITLNLSPTLCSMLRDPLLQERCSRRLDVLVEFAERELQRTRWEQAVHELALFYHARLCRSRERYHACGLDPLRVFKRLLQAGRIEITSCAASHGLLPLLAQHPPSVRAQVLVARDCYRECFDSDPRGLWLPECAYVESLEPVIREAGLRWFITESHGILHAQPRPRCAVFAPVLTPNSLAAFGRDRDSARQVWSREEGYPGDPRYRDFYRDAGFDLELNYVQPALPSPDHRGFTGLKYHRITAPSGTKQVYQRALALEAAREHAAHFLRARAEQVLKLADILDRPPLMVCPYDAELFGHWWYEGPEFLDCLVRAACASNGAYTLVTPESYLRLHPTNQLATPSPSSWGEDGHWRVWLNETNQWIYPHLDTAQRRMSELAEKQSPGPLEERALRQAARELLLAQSSDWPFLLHGGASADYARRRVEEHLQCFTKIYQQTVRSELDEAWLADIESRNNLFPQIDWRYWRSA